MVFKKVILPEFYLMSKELILTTSLFYKRLEIMERVNQMTIDMQDPIFSLVDNINFFEEKQPLLKSSEEKVSALYQIYREKDDVKKSFGVFKEEYENLKPRISLEVRYTTSTILLARKGFDHLQRSVYKGDYLIEFSEKDPYFMLYWKGKDYSHCYDPASEGLYIFTTKPSEDFYRLVEWSSQRSGNQCVTLKQLQGRNPLSLSDVESP